MTKAMTPTVTPSAETAEITEMNGLPAPGQQVAGRDVELEGQRHAVSPKPMPAPVTPVTEEPGEKRAVSPVTPRLARMRGKQDFHADLTGSLVRRGLDIETRRRPSRGFAGPTRTLRVLRGT